MFKNLKFFIFSMLLWRLLSITIIINIFRFFFIWSHFLLSNQMFHFVYLALLLSYWIIFMELWVREVTSIFRLVFDLQIKMVEWTFKLSLFISRSDNIRICTLKSVILSIIVKCPKLDFYHLFSVRKIKSLYS